MVYSYKGILSSNTKNELMICNSKDESQKLFWAKEGRHKKVFIWLTLCNIQNQEKLIYKYRNQNWMIMGVETYWKEACENVMGWCTYSMQSPPLLCGQDGDYDGGTAVIKLHYRTKVVLQIMYTKVPISWLGAYQKWNYSGG